MRIKKTHLWLLLFVSLAIVLRLIAAAHVDVNPDEMIYTLIPLNIISAERLSTVEQAPLFFYLTDIGYQLFGFNAITARLPNIIFGSLSIILVFLISQLIFHDAKKSLVSSFLLAISGFATINNIEIDIGAFFFLLLSIYFYMLFYVKAESYLYLSALALGLGILFKPSVALVIIPYFMYYGVSLLHPAEKRGLALNAGHGGSNDENTYTPFRKAESRRPLYLTLAKHLFLSLGILLLVVSPVLVYNYLLYVDKGITDFYFTTMLGIGENIYQGLGGQKPWSFQMAIGVVRDFSSTLLRFDTVLFLLGIIGLLHTLIKKNRWAIFFSGFLLIYFLYMGGRSGSPAHYVIVVMTLALFSGHSFFLLLGKLSSFSKKKSWMFLLLLIGLTTIAIQYPEINDPSSVVLLQKFSSQISDNAIVVVDPLLYRGIYSWALPDKHYLEGTYFPQLAEQLQSLSGEKITVPLYYIRCDRNSFCGWKAEDYARIFNFSESLSTYFQEELQFVTSIQGSDVLRFSIYLGSISIPPEIYPTIDQTHSFYFYPVGWASTEKVVDAYSLDTPFESFLQKIGFLILFMNVGLAFLSMGAVFYFLGKHSG